jgi:murein L,D-transpeptidase YafK
MSAVARFLVVSGCLVCAAHAVAPLAAPEARAGSFEREQRRVPRVEAALTARKPALNALFTAAGAPFPPRGILLRAFKREAALELWADRGDGRFVLVQTYGICASSGALGPKRREGDGQVPEGFYRVNHFNPASAFHLSLGIDYPNAVDRRASGPRPGGAIYIHGSCVTIGCLPITDEKIEEVYVAAVLARDGGQAAIPVHVFPARLTEPFFAELAQTRAAPPALVSFWRNLKEGFDLFERDRRLPQVVVGHDGRYRFR